MMVIDNTYELYQEVYLKTDKEQLMRIVIGICQKPSGILYQLACLTYDSWHYECEISVEKNVVITTTN